MKHVTTFENAAQRHWLVALVALSMTLIALGCQRSDAGPPPLRSPMPSSSSPSSALPAPTPRGFRHKRSSLVVATGAANHRGRDVLVVVGEPQQLEAKLAYGPADKDLSDEDVLFRYELPDGSGHRDLGIVRTSHDGPDDDGGRARFTIPRGEELPIGRHVIRATVLGDGTEATLVLLVVPNDQSVFVSDVDGTLTESEVAELPALASGKLPAAHPHASLVFQRLVAQGLVPVYLTARPEWLMGRTRAFLQANGFPPGVVLTRKDKSGGYGASAAAFKRAELERLARRFRIEWAFGNMPSDADAYAGIVRDPRRRILYRYADPEHRARRIEGYAELLSELGGR